MDELFTQLMDRLNKQGLNECAIHFSHARSAYERSEWESANAQIRTALEALYDGIAKIRLKTDKTGGKARKQLEDSGLLRPREARLVQEFIAVAGGAGSHAGVSNSDESKGRILAGIGVAFIGLALIPELIKVEDVLIGNLSAPANARLPTDKEIYTTCPTCGAKQTLSEASIMRKETETIYTCLNGCQPIAVVGEPGKEPWEGRGYRLGSHVIRNPSDMHLPIVGSQASVELLVPASKSALMKDKASDS